MPEPLNAAIYDRVSKDRRGDQRSVGEQNHLNRAVCTEHGWTVVDAYVDNDRSASRFATTGRPDWERLLDDLTAGRFDVLVMWESSRGDRKSEDWMRFLSTCRDHGVLIHVTTHERTYDMTVPRDWKILAEEGVSNAYASEETSLRVRRATSRQAAAGMPHGKLLYGYRREYDPTTGALIRQVIDDAPRLAMASGCAAAGPVLLTSSWYSPADVIREGARRVLAGESLRAIAGDFNARRIPTPRRGKRGWTLEQLGEQLRNPAYIARRIHRGEDVGEAKWPPLLNEMTFHGVAARLSAPERRTMREGAIKHLLSGIAVCGVCSEPLRVLRNRGRLTYSCWRRVRGEGAGFHVARLEARLDAFVTKVLIARLAGPDLTEAWQAGAGVDGEMRKLLEELETKRAQLEADIAEAISSGMRPALLARMDQARSADIEALERRVRRVRLSPMVAELADPDAEVVAARWAGLSLTQKREMIRGWCERIEVLPAGKGRRSYDDWEVTRFVWRGAGGAGE
jgi:DNA invertase Pin-like site-specific DNA recombinase